MGTIQRYGCSYPRQYVLEAHRPHKGETDDEDCHVIAGWAEWTGIYMWEGTAELEADGLIVEDNIMNVSFVVCGALERGREAHEGNIRYMMGRSGSAEL
jgi:hypothetical protein